MRSKSTTLVKAAQTVKVEPRRGTNDKAPWKTLDLTAITGQTIEKAHLFDVHLGETVVPYATLTPLKALLPLKQGDDGTARGCQWDGRHSSWWVGTADAGTVAAGQCIMGAA